MPSPEIYALWNTSLKNSRTRGVITKARGFKALNVHSEQKYFLGLA